MRRGLRPRQGGRGRAAVIALDLITDFEFPDGPAVRRALTIRVDAIRALLGKARANRVPVIYANDNLGPWRSDAPALIRYCIESQRAEKSNTNELLRPDPSDYFLLKPRHSAFFGTPLAALLDDLKVGTLIVTGISAESCVWITACDAHTRGFELVIPADTMAGVTPPA